jgi:hypothetical protein
MQSEKVGGNTEASALQSSEVAEPSSTRPEESEHTV